MLRNVEFGVDGLLDVREEARLEMGIGEVVEGVEEAVDLVKGLEDVGVVGVVLLGADEELLEEEGVLVQHFDGQLESAGIVLR